MSSLEEDDYGVTSINSSLNSSNNSFYNVDDNTSLNSSFISTNTIESFLIRPIDLNNHSQHEDDVEAESEEEEREEEMSQESTTPIQSSLSAFLNLNSSLLSEPSSPTSHSSKITSGGVSHKSDDKSESGTTTSGSNRSSGSQSGEGEVGRSELVMPFLDIGSRSRAGESKEYECREKESTSRILIYGSNDRTRRKLAGLLGERNRLPVGRDSELDLSASYITNPYSDSSRNSSSGGGRFVSEDLGNLVELSDGTSSSTFYTTTRDATSAQLFEQLLIPLEQTEALLNPCYPSTERLAEFVLKGEDSSVGSVDACLMLFSSPPTASEVATARTLSKLVPIFVLLLLPPSPSSRPQKTAILLEAVHTQLTNAGVHYTAAFETGKPTSSSTTKPFYCLPSDVFDDDFFSETSSMASSQELLPPPSSSTSTSTSSASPLCHQATHYRDLNRLRSLVSTPAARDRIKRIKVLSFLEWREVHLAARGIRQVPLSKLYGEVGVEILESNLEKDLEFSKRVAERRLEIEKSQKELKGVQDLFQQNENHEFIGMSTSTLGPTTRFPPLPPLGSSEYYETKNYLDQSASYFPPSASPKSNLSPNFIYPSASSVDPFHIPSLLQLVGLNLRLSLLPPPTNTNSYSGGVRSGNLVVMWGVVSFAFALGIFCGKGSILIWRD